MALRVRWTVRESPSPQAPATTFIRIVKGQGTWLRAKLQSFGDLRVGGARPQGEVHI